jgi:chemotaxis protein CheC
MTHAAHHDGPRARAIDRLRELASVGAGHACGALATLLGRPFVMSVPETRVLARGDAAAPFATTLEADELALGGVLFTVNGGPGGALALLLAPATRAALARALLGARAQDAAQVGSALNEVGNIVASHALGAMGDLLGARMLPSPPRGVAEGAAEAFAQLASAEARSDALLRIEV